MSKFFIKLDLPKIPRELLVPKMENVGYAKDIGYGHTHIKNGRTVKPCSYTFGKIAHLPLASWLIINLKNIPVNRLSIKISDGGDTHVIHSDFGRIAHLNYWWDLGGDNVVTSWYKEKGKPLYRDFNRPRGVQSDSGFVDYNNCELLESTKFEKETWYLFCSNVLHDVENLTGKREGLAISFSTVEELKAANLPNLFDLN